MSLILFVVALFPPHLKEFVGLFHVSHDSWSAGFGPSTAFTYPGHKLSEILAIRVIGRYKMQGVFSARFVIIRPYFGYSSLSVHPTPPTGGRHGL